MDAIGRRLLFSASDLVNHSACEYLTSLELASALSREVRPDFMTPDTAARVRRGFEHEERFLASLVAAGNRTYAVETDRTSNDGLLLNAVQTAVALQSEDIDVVYQPTFFELDAEFAWQGHGDFAIRNERGVFEIWDTKLARSVSTKMLIQLGKYSMMLGAAQGSMPEYLHVVLGDGRRESFRVDEITPFVRAFERKFTADIRSADFPTRPEPVKHCDVCARREHCEERWIDEDHLSLVWNLDKRTRRLLEDAGITTVRQLAATGVGVEVPGLKRSVFEDTVAQAALQVRGRAAGELIYELRRPEPATGYSVLPRPRPSDLFLDFEFNDLEVIAGDVRGKGRPSRFAYLFAVAEASDPERPTVETFWADTTSAEKANILALARRIATARALDREMHVYHWGSVDRSIMRTLLEYHGVKRIDFILDAFVDLYAIFEQGGRLSARSLGLKEAEKLWSPSARASEGVDGASSIALREQYRHSRSRAERADLRRQLEEYCGEDTVQLIAGRAYLVQQVEELFQRRMFPVAADRHQGGTGRDENPDDLEESGVGTRIGDLLVGAADSLRAGLPKQPARDNAGQQTRRMLADLMDWHRRERRPEWSELFELRRAAASRAPKARAAFLQEHDVALGGLEFRADLSGPVERSRYTARGVGFNPDKSVLERYLFPMAQEHELKVDLRVEDPGTGEQLTIVDIDETFGSIVVKRSRARAFDEEGRWIPVRNLIPGDLPPVTQLQRSLLRVAERVLDGRVSAQGPYGLAAQLLRGTAPRVRGHRRGTPLVAPGEDQTEAVVRLVNGLDRGVLAVQGPPGSGKTYAAARAVVEYLKRHPDTDAGIVKIGVMASSHKVIGNLLEEIARQAELEGIKPGVIHLNRGVDAADRALVRTVKDSKAMANAAKHRTAHVFGGTAWYFAREEHTVTPFDLLVVDEAGQISLADTVAAAPAAKNMLLVGDPAQLTQPIRGAHPNPVKVSALGRFLGDDVTMAPDRGVFFEYTRRLGANCGFVSQMFYDGKLQSHPKVARQQVVGFPGIAGLEFIPVEHLGNRPNTKSSPEEAERVRELVETLLTSCRIDEGNGTVRPVTPDDILVVAPFRRQVDRIRRTVANDAVSVLTVDKAQGQEAAIVIYSMARSAANREEFLLSRNRMNVAISRARALSVVVASPKVFEPLVTSPDALRRMGTHLRFIELASDRVARTQQREQLLLLDFGQRVRQARTDLGLTQRDFAEAIGVSTTTVKRIERGRTSGDAADAVAAYLGWDPSRIADVLDGTDRAALVARSTADLVASMTAPVGHVDPPVLS